MTDWPLYTRVLIAFACAEALFLGAVYFAPR